MRTRLSRRTRPLLEEEGVVRRLALAEEDVALRERTAVLLDELARGRIVLAVEVAEGVAAAFLAGLSAGILRHAADDRASAGGSRKLWWRRSRRGRMRLVRHGARRADDEGDQGRS